MQGRGWSRALAVMGAVVVLASAARADDNAQIEKARDLLHEADIWIGIGCSDKANEALAKAEKELEGVDETGKAEPLASIKECREKLATYQKGWDAHSYKGMVEREIATGESDAMHDPDGNSLGFDRAQAQLDDSWNKAHFDAATLTELQKKLAWSRKKASQARNADDQQRTMGALGRSFDLLDETVKGAKTTIDQADYLKKHFAEQVDDIEKVVAEHEKSLGPDNVADYKKKIAAARKDFEANLGEAQVTDLQRIDDRIQEVLDGKNTSYYTSNVEEWFKNANARAATCPQDDPRTKALVAKLGEQRKQFDSMVAKGTRDETVKPIIDWWKSCKEYGKDCDGWEQETKPSALSDYIHHAPPQLGCEKTQKLLEEVVQRFYQNDRVAAAQAKYPNDPELKAVLDEASALREKASAKVIQFMSALLDEAEKLPPGDDRKSMQMAFYNFKNTAERTAKGSAGVAALLARVDALDKKWQGETAAGEAAKAAQDKKVCDSVVAAWPDLAKGWLGKVKRLDATDAVANPGGWKGTVVHFSGGSRGVNMNRAGWDYFTDFAFVTEVDGVPVCGDLDSGVYDAIREVEKQTGVDEDNCEEAIGIVEGTCKITQRVKVFDQYVKGDTLTGVKIRIVGWRACTVCAVAGEGTNLSKLPEYKEVSVKEQGVTTGGSQGGRHGGSSAGASGGGGGWIHRLVAWAMCALLALGGALALAHGAAKFVPALQENLAKLGDGLGYAGIGFAVVGVLWFVGALVFWVLWGHGGSLPSTTLVLAGAFVGLDLLRAKGKLKPETASMIQPAGILLGLGCFFEAMVHFIAWDVTLL